MVASEVGHLVLLGEECAVLFGYNVLSLKLNFETASTGAWRTHQCRSRAVPPG